MPITMSGMSSGIDTDAIIDKLVKVEGKPIRQLEIRKKGHNNRKTALQGLSKILAKISSLSKELYGFRASYDDKKAISSNPDALNAKANKKSEKGIKKIKIHNIASAHKITSDPISENEELPPGKIRIEVNGESHVIRFKGGKLKRLMERLEDTASDIISTSYIKTSGDNHIITLQSKVTGKKGEIKINGDKGFLKKLGLVQGARSARKETSLA